MAVMSQNMVLTQQGKHTRGKQDILSGWMPQN